MYSKHYTHLNSKHLTKDNRPNGGYITREIEFFETKDAYYLVMEYVGDYNLAQFVIKCHEYIKQRKLKLSDYKKVCKFIFWQICVMIHWMHNDMKCVHLGLFFLSVFIIRVYPFSCIKYRFNDGKYHCSG